MCQKQLTDYSKNIEYLMLMLRFEMNTVGKWLRANKLTLNISKSKFVLFGTPAKLRGLPDIILRWVHTEQCLPSE